jgi:hypothetical protein
VWNPINPDPNFPASPGNWDVAANWTADVPGVTDQKPVFNVVGAAECQVTTTVPTFSSNLVQGDGTDGGVLRVMNGGTINAGDPDAWCGIGFNSTGHTIVETGGTLHAYNHLWIGQQVGGDGTLDIAGGYVRCDEMFGIGFEGGVGQVNISDGGILDLHNFNDTRSFGGLDQSLDCSLDIEFGEIVFDGIHSGKLTDELVDGRITGFKRLAPYGGQTTAVTDDSSGNTVVTAPDPMNRTPGYDGIVVGTGTKTLTWSKLTPVAPATSVLVDVWFGTDTGTWTEVDNDFAGETSVAVTVAEGDYVWKVDSYLYGNPASVQYDLNDNDPNFPPVVRGTVLPFSVVDDAPPTIVVDTVDMLTWAGEPVTLTATVTDDLVSASSVAWSSPADANIVYSAESYVYPTATVTVTSDSHQPNTTITATVTDGNPLGLDDSDTVLVDFAEDACQGAGGGFQHLWDVYQADYDNDCIIDLSDFAQMAAQWMDNYALTGPIDIVPVP